MPKGIVKMVQLVAKQRFPYDGRHLEPGEHFEESESYALILTALGKADYMMRVDTPAEADPSIDDLRDQARAAGVKVDGRWAEQRLRDEIAKAGRYQRRDMRAQD